MQRDRSAKTAYNELVVDGKGANQRLPQTVEAFFMYPSDPGNGQGAREMHRSFLAAFPQLSPSEVPLLVYRPDHPHGPFLPADETAHGTAIDAGVRTSAEALPMARARITAENLAILNIRGGLRRARRGRGWGSWLVRLGGEPTRKEPREG